MVHHLIKEWGNSVQGSTKSGVMWDTRTKALLGLKFCGIAHYDVYNGCRGLKFVLEHFEILEFWWGNLGHCLIRTKLSLEYIQIEC